MTTLADRLLPDQLWERVQPLLPPPPSHARGGAPRTVSDRACMAVLALALVACAADSDCEPPSRPGVHHL